MIKMKNNFDKLDVEGIIGNIEDEIGVIRNIDGFIWNKEDTIDIERLPEVAKSEVTKVGTAGYNDDDVTEYVINSITDELKSLCYI